MELQNYSRVVTFKMDPQLLELVDRTARELSISRSELIRAAIEEFLSKLGALVSRDENFRKNDVNRSNLDIEVILL